MHVLSVNAPDSDQARTLTVLFIFILSHFMQNVKCFSQNSPTNTQIPSKNSLCSLERDDFPEYPQQVHSEAHSADILPGDDIRAEHLAAVQRDKKLSYKLSLFHRSFQIFNEGVFVLYPAGAALLYNAVAQ